MAPGNVDDVNAPQGIQNIVQAVTEYVIRHTPEFEGRLPTSFDIYDRALHAIWPELHKSSPEAHLRVGISIYIDIAERWGFEVPAEIKGLKL